MNKYRIGAWLNSLLTSQKNDSQEGQGLVEYGAILVMIAVLVIVVLVIMGNQLKNMFTNVKSVVK
jgi:Flp pilus assembly pilin Flp